MGRRCSTIDSPEEEELLRMLLTSFHNVGGWSRMAWSCLQRWQEDWSSAVWSYTTWCRSTSLNSKTSAWMDQRLTKQLPARVVVKRCWRILECGCQQLWNNQHQRKKAERLTSWVLHQWPWCHPIPRQNLCICSLMPEPFPGLGALFRPHTFSKKRLAAYLSSACIFCCTGMYNLFLSWSVAKWIYNLL